MRAKPRTRRAAEQPCIPVPVLGVARGQRYTWIFSLGVPSRRAGGKKDLRSHVAWWREVANVLQWKDPCRPLPHRARTTLLWTTVGRLPFSSLFPKTQPESRCQMFFNLELMDQDNEKLLPMSEEG